MNSQQQVRIEKDQNDKLIAIDIQDGNKVGVPKGALMRGYAGTGYLERTAKGWKQIQKVEYIPPVDSTNPDKEHAEVLAMIHSSYKLKPDTLMMSEIK